jgi:hypothetical protein
MPDLSPPYDDQAAAELHRQCVENLLAKLRRTLLACPGGFALGLDLRPHADGLVLTAPGKTGAELWTAFLDGPPPASPK